jgi:D-sedoheptulose 7-phosphate isomerase
MVGELMKGFVLRRPVPLADAEKLRDAGCEDWQELAANLQCGIASIALTAHTALTSAVVNDNDGDTIFAQQVYVYARPGDLVMGISTSGNSKNVVSALQVGRAFGLITIGLVGSRACRMDEICDILINVPEEETYKIQELHLPVYHTLCLMAEHELFDE